MSVQFPPHATPEMHSSKLFALIMYRCHSRSLCTESPASPLDVVCFNPFLPERIRLHAFLRRRHGSSCRNILKVIIKVYSRQDRGMNRMVYAVLCRGLLAPTAENLLRQRGGWGSGGCLTCQRRLSSGGHHRTVREAALAAMCRWFGFDVGATAITTPRASTRTSSQTFGRNFGGVRLAHPGLLFDLMRMNCIPLSRRVSRRWSWHATGWGGSATTHRTMLHRGVMRRRGTAHGPTVWAKWISRRSACTATWRAGIGTSVDAHLIQSSCS